jgi:hypothetical protein
LQFEVGITSQWFPSALIVPLPQSRLYQTCFSRNLPNNLTGRATQRQFMQDEQCCVFIDPIEGGTNTRRGYVDFIFRFKNISQAFIDDDNPKLLVIVYFQQVNKTGD